MAAAEAAISPSGGLALVQLHQLTSVTRTSISHRRASLPAAVLTQDGNAIGDSENKKLLFGAYVSLATGTKVKLR